MFFLICHNINRQKLPCTTVFACFIFTIRAMRGERGAASLRLIAALLLVNRNGVAGESSPCDWLPSNPSPLTAATQLLTCDSSQLTCYPAAFNRGKATLTCESSQLTCCSAAIPFAHIITCSRFTAWAISGYRYQDNNITRARLYI